LLDPGEAVAVLGISYKPDTYIVEESAGLHLAQCLKRRGYRVTVHDYAATPSNSPSLHEFEVIEDPHAFQDRKDIKIAVVCCPWPKYKAVSFHANTKVVAPWKL
jgi:UDPglucose 6-dehydrogenase